MSEKKFMLKPVMRKRLFIGCLVSKKLQNEIYSWRKKQNLPVRWIAEKNLHLTIIPPFYDDEKKIIDLIKNFSLTSKHFFLKFNKIVSGPTRKTPRLIWLEGDKNSFLEILKKELEDNLPIKPEKRELLPHITIARFPKNVKLRISENFQFMEHIESLSLLESKLSRKGAEYEEIIKIKLKSSI